MTGLNFTIEGRGAGRADPQKTYLWQFKIPTINRIIPFADPEGLILSCKSASIPASGETEVIESKWMGSTEYFAGKRTPPSDLTLEFEEREDTLIHDTFHAWANLIHDIDPESPSAGASHFDRKRGGYAVDAFLETYKSDKTTILNTVMYKNLWLVNIDAFDLNYDDGSSAVRYNCTFKYDYPISLP